MIKILKHLVIREPFRLIKTLLPGTYRIIKKLHFVYPSGKRLFVRTAGYTHLLRCQGLAVGGCCEAAAYGIHPWTPWIWGILDFRSIRYFFSPSQETHLIFHPFNYLSPSYTRSRSSRSPIV